MPFPAGRKGKATASKYAALSTADDALLIVFTPKVDAKVDILYFLSPSISGRS